MIEYFLFAAVVLIILMIGAIIRLFIGPTLPDRIIAVDTINTMTVAVLIVLAVYYQQFIFIDVAIVYALLSFVSTLYFAKIIGGEL
jgi:multicomponent Na+:H+ antiporter subunit F